MTPKFDNLASLLMEMPSGGHNRIPDETRLKIGVDIEAGKISYEAIGKKHGVGIATVTTIAKELEVGAGSGRSAAFFAGSEKHVARKLSNAQELQVLDYWMANHHETTHAELARWVSQQFNVPLMTKSALGYVLIRAAAKHNERLPPGDRGKGMRLRRQRSQYRNEPGSGKLPTQGPHHFKGSTDIVPSNIKHGGPAHPPTPPMDQDKRL